MGAISNIFGYILNWLYEFFNNYGIAIIILSVLLRIILIPITIKQQSTMKKTAKLQEQMKILQVKEGINIEYIAMFMSITRLIGDTHKRYWISEYSKIEIPIPPQNEQDRIVKKVRLLFSRLDEIMENL